MKKIKKHKSKRSCLLKIFPEKEEASTMPISDHLKCFGSLSLDPQINIKLQEKNSKKRRLFQMKQPTTHQNAKLGSKSISKFPVQNYLLHLSQVIKFHLGRISAFEKLQQKFTFSISMSQWMATMFFQMVVCPKDESSSLSKTYASPPKSVIQHLFQ